MNGIQNPKSLTTIYNSPSLDSVSLHEVVIHRNSIITLRFDLPNFPDHPPAKWHQEFNTCQVTLDIFGVRELKVSGFAAILVGDLFFDGSKPPFAFSFCSDLCTISCMTDGARVQKISGYQAA